MTDLVTPELKREILKDVIEGMRQQQADGEEVTADSNMPGAEGIFCDAMGRLPTEAERAQLSRIVVTALFSFNKRSRSNGRPKVLREPRSGRLHPPRRTSRAKETWRILRNYPAYEISSHGRVRALARAKGDDWLKPRWQCLRGKWIPYVVLTDKDGIRCERQEGWLMVEAGFREPPYTI